MKPLVSLTGRNKPFHETSIRVSRAQSTADRHLQNNNKNQETAEIKSEMKCMKI